MAGHAVDRRVLDRLDDDVVAEPVDADLADLLGEGRRAEADGCAENEGRKNNVAHRNS